MFLICIICVFNIHVLAAEAKSTDGDVISELAAMKERFLEREKFYEKRFADMASMQKERFLQREDFNKKRFAEMENRLYNAEEHSKSLVNSFQIKLAEAMGRFNKEVKRRTSVETFLENKIARLEHKLSENGYGQEDSEIVSQDFASGTEPKTAESQQKLSENGQKDEENESKEVGSGTEPVKQASKENTNTTGTAELITTEYVLPLFERKLKNKGKRLLTPSGGNKIAFSSYLSSTAKELGREHTIPFDQVLLNEGQSFDTVLHAFICPVNGIYMFQSSLLCDNGDHIETEIVKDGSVLARMYASGQSSMPLGFDQGFNSASVRCNKGERVWIRVRSHNGNVVYAEQFTTFSGFLLWEI